MLDGIIPKDFGKPEVGSGMLANLLEKRPEMASQRQQFVNGVAQQQKVIVNHTVVNGGLKRPASVEPNGEGNGIPPSKRPMLDCNGTVIANGPNVDNDVVKSDVNLGQAVFQNNNTTLTQQQGGLVIQPSQAAMATTPGGQKIVTGADGKQYIVKTGPGCGNGTVIGTVTATPVSTSAMMQPQQQPQQINGNGQVLLTQNAAGGGKTIIILQPQAKVLTSSTGQVMVQNTQPQTVMVQPQTLVVHNSAGVPQQVLLQNTGGGQPQVLVQNSGGGQPQVLVQNTGGVQPQVLVQNTGGAQPQVMVQNTGGAQPQILLQNTGMPQQVMVQNAAGVQQQVLVQNPATVATTIQPQTIMRAVTTQQQTTTMTFSPRPQLVTSVVQRPVATPPPQQPQQVPIQGLVRVTTPPVVQPPVQVPTPPPATTIVTSAAPSPVPQTLIVPATTPTPPSVPIPKPDPAAPFLCEWHGCMKAFKSPKDVERHAITAHCPVGSDDIPCLWLRCDGMKRKRFSLMTHLQDRHCHPQVSVVVKVIKHTRWPDVRS